MKITLQKDGSLLERDVEALKRYFTNVIELAKNNDENAFVVDIEDVWPLAYSRKDPCLRVLHSDFIKGVDYKEETIETSSIGRNEVRVTLTLKCMEFLVARRVRAVFEVYRRMFHAAVEKARIASEWQKMLVNQGSDLLPLSDDNTPYDERVWNNGWACIANYTTSEFMYLLKVRNDYETTNSGKTKDQIDREYLLAHIPVVNNFLYQLIEHYSTYTIGKERADLLMAIKHLNDWRAWFENHNLSTAAKLHVPVGFNYDWANCLRILTLGSTRAQVEPKRMVRTAVLGSEM